MPQPTDATPQAVLHKNLHNAVFDVRMFGAVVDGATNDSSAVNAAIDAANAAGGGTVLFPSGTCMCNVTIKPEVRLVGAGVGATILKSVASSNADVIKGVNFATLTGKSYAAGDYALGAYDCGIEHMTIDGNKANEAGGYGIRIWGKALRFHNVIVQNCDNDGIWTEFTTHDNGNVDNEPGGFFHNIWTSNNGGNGWTFRGPHDSTVSDLTTWSNAAWGLKSETVAGSYNGTIGAGYRWNSWLNADSFYLGLGGMNLTSVSATGVGGTGIEIASGGGGVNIQNGLISGHTVGMKARGSTHTFSGEILNCATGIQWVTSVINSRFDFTATGVTTLIDVSGSSGGNLVNIAANATGATVISGTPSTSDAFHVAAVSGTPASFSNWGGISVYQDSSIGTAALRTDTPLALTSFIDFTERADPAAGSTNHGRLYVKDNGAGKSQLVVRFPTGAVQVIATEP